MDKLALLAELTPEQGTVAGTEHAEEQVRGETTFVEISWNTPTGDALGGINLPDEISASDTPLRRLLVRSDIDEGSASETAKPPLGGREDFFWRHATAEG